mgnify:CR=1 FL=1
MNPHTGELAMLREGEERAGFERLPAILQAQAREKMRRFADQIARAERAETESAPKVNLLSRSPLAKWAKDKRKAKIAASSRRRSRK